MADDVGYFDLENLIADRIRLVDGLRAVRIFTDLSQVQENAGQGVPAAYIVWHGEQADPTRHAGSSQVVEHVWVIILAIQDNRPEQHRKSAGLILARINRLLQGWQPPITPNPTDPIRVAGKMRKTSAPEPFYDAGFGFFCLAYTIPMVVEGVSSSMCFTST